MGEVQSLSWRTVEETRIPVAPEVACFGAFPTAEGLNKYRTAGECCDEVLTFGAVKQTEQL